MAWDRYFDPVKRDYVIDKFGQFQTTDNASTAVYHQILDRKGQWAGDPEAGSTLYQLPRISTQVIANAAAQMIRDCLKPLIDARLIADSEVNAIRNSDKSITVEGVARDLKGNDIDLTDLLSGGA